MRIKHKPTVKEGDKRVKTRFAYCPVTCCSSLYSNDIETRWAEVVTTVQELKLIGFEEEPHMVWVDLYFVDEGDTNHKA